jgi:hypothetical protein
MADDPKKKARRKALGFWDAQDRVIKLNSMYRIATFGNENTSAAARMVHDQLDDVSTPEPNEELIDSDLSDVERRSAITRERMRREGLL